MGIDIGRHTNIPIERRICVYCQSITNKEVIDCEHHAIYHCLKCSLVCEQFLLSWYKKGTSLDDFYFLMNSDSETNLKNICIVVYHVLYINLNIHRGQSMYYECITNSFGPETFVINKYFYLT